MMVQETPSEQWQHHATAFLARCRGQMWGKHKEEPLAWMFRAGFTVSFAEEAFFGWNFRPMTRNAASWFGPDHEGESFFLPQGLVLPWIHEQKILRLSILKPDGESLVLPGSSGEIMEKGEGRTLVLLFSDGDFFRLAQKMPEGFSMMSSPLPDRILKRDLTPFEKIFLVSGDREKAGVLLEKLQQKGLSFQLVQLPEKEIVSSLLQKRLTEDDLSLMLSPAV